MIRINWWILKMGKFCVWIFHFIFLNRPWILKDFMYTKKICNKTNCTFNAALHTVLLIDWRCIGFWSATWFLQVSWEICLKVSLEMINLGKLSPSLTPHFLNPSHFRRPVLNQRVPWHHMPSPPTPISTQSIENSIWCYYTWNYLTWSPMNRY